MTATITNRQRAGQSARSRKQSPAFLLYCKDWRSSRTVHGMSFAERGMFLEMLIEQWLEGAAPASPDACAVRFGGRIVAWKTAWKKLENCFVLRKRDGLLINLKLQRIRQEREAFLKSQRQSGLRGAQQRWQAHSEPIASPSQAHTDPNASPMAKHGHRSGSDLDLKEKEKEKDHSRRNKHSRLSPISQSFAKAYREVRK